MLDADELTQDLRRWKEPVQTKDSRKHWQREAWNAFAALPWTECHLK
jgi:hypothetical protein